MINRGTAKHMTVQVDKLNLYSCLGKSEVEKTVLARHFTHGRPFRRHTPTPTSHETCQTSNLMQLLGVTMTRDKQVQAVRCV